jgi:hypothetical protein
MGAMVRACQHEPYVLRPLVRGLWGDKHLSAGDGFIVVFSVTDAQSLQDLDAFKTQILRAKDSPKVRASRGLLF